MQPTNRDDRSLPDLFRDLTRDVTTLVRQEVELARAEMTEKVTQVMSAVVGFVAGGVTLLAALLVFVYLAILGLEAAGLEPWLATLIVGVVLVVLGLIAIFSARSKLKAQSLAPKRTAESLRRDAELVREQVR